MLPDRKACCVTVLLLTLAAVAPVPATPQNQPALPSPTTSGVDHIVVVTMENRSFDHLLGWHPTADARQRGLSYPDELGRLQPTTPLAPDYQGCAHPDPDHSWEGGRIEYDGGAMDGFLLAGSNARSANGFHRERDRP